MLCALGWYIQSLKIGYIVSTAVFLEYRKEVKEVKEGFNLWRNCAIRLEEHEESKSHLAAMTSCLEATERLNSNTGIEKSHQEIIDFESKR